MHGRLLRGPAGAQTSGGERIRRFDSTIEVADNGTVTVTEEITYDFGSNQRHGIERTIPVRYPYDDVKEGYDRVTPLDVVLVTADPGTPSGYTRSSSGLDTTLRIGDADTLITGAHTYRITYRLRGAINHFEDHDELYLNVTGNEWAVPIDEVTATVDGPAAPTQVACFAGPRRRLFDARAIQGAQGALGARGDGRGRAGRPALTRCVPRDGAAHGRRRARRAR